MAHTNMEFTSVIDKNFKLSKQTKGASLKMAGQKPTHPDNNDFKAHVVLQIFP